MTDRNSGVQGHARLFRACLSAALAGAIVGGGGWALLVRHDGEAMARPTAGVTTRYDRVFGNVYYKVPAGYRAVQQAGGVAMVRNADALANNIQGVLLISPGLPLTAQLRKELKAKGKPAFVQGIAIAFANLAKDPNAKLSNPAPVNDPAKDGYEAFALKGESFDSDAGQKRFTVFVVVLTPSRVEAFMKIGYGSEANLNALDGGFDALTGSAEFRDAGAPPPSRLAPALPTSMAALTPTPAPRPAPSARGDATPAPSTGTGRSCGVRYRQQCSYTGAGAYQSYNCFSVPYTPPGCK